MKKNDGFTLIELLVTLVIVAVILSFIIAMMSSQYAIIRDVDAYLVMSNANKDVNNALIREFIKAEEIWIDTDGDGPVDPQSLDDDTIHEDVFSEDGSDLVNITLKYVDDEGDDKEITFEKNGAELLMNGTALDDHLSPGTPVAVSFYKRLSQDMKIVNLVKIKITYLHDGISKQYDLFYHLRNLSY